MRVQPTLFVLGASRDQRFLIETAKTMGCYVLAADQNPDAEAFDIVDENVIISTRDLDGLLCFIDSYRKKRPIDGVITMGSEIPLTVATLAAELSVPSISTDTAYLASNKLAMKKRWAETGIPIPWFSEVTSGAHLCEIVAERGWQLIVKPTDRSGARGITKLLEGMDCHDVFAKARSFSYEGKVIVEEFLTGAQLSTESIVYDDFFKTGGVSDRNYEDMEGLNGTPIENGGTMPSIIDAKKLHQVDHLLETAARSLGIHRGVAKGDVAFDADGNPRMIEMAARLSGGWMSSGLIPVTTGVNIVETMIEISLGRKPDLSKLNPKWLKHSALRYFFPPPGVLKKIENIEQVRKYAWLQVLEFYKEVGERLEWPDSHAARFGGFLLEGNSREEVLDRVSRVYETVTFQIT